MGHSNHFITWVSCDTQVQCVTGSTVQFGQTRPFFPVWETMETCTNSRFCTCFCLRYLVLILASSRRRASEQANRTGPVSARFHQIPGVLSNHRQYNCDAMRSHDRWGRFLTRTTTKKNPLSDIFNMLSLIKRHENVQKDDASKFILGLSSPPIYFFFGSLKQKLIDLKI